jgi:hypothetical protein
MPALAPAVSKVLTNTHRVVVTNRKILLQISLDVMLYPKPLVSIR